ncbi:MAG: hypothetical protein WC884_03175 [Candidatus Paceibacterota bacterium]
MKKYLLYTLIILIALVGFLGVVKETQAQLNVGRFCETNGGRNGTPDDEACVAAANACVAQGIKPISNDPGSDFRKCVNNYKPAPNQPPPAEPTNPFYKACLNIDSKANCLANNPDTPAYTACIASGKTPNECQDVSIAADKTAQDPANSYFEAEIKKNKCSLTGILTDGTFYPGCFIQASYALFYVIPGFLLWLSAYFFNVLIFTTLNSTLLTSNFVPEAWAVTRDLSNLFFILILLYVAIKMILGLAGTDVKKTISQVIIMALLINFSMFFTKVVIDTSNILALIFYNKVQVSTKNSDGTERQYESTANGEKDVAGGMVNAFNPTSLLTADFFKKAGEQTVPGFFTVKGSAPPGILIGLTIITGLLMLFAAYCFFVAGISFIGRLIELFILIIFSPFAFMSSTIPLLGTIDYIGWDAWLKRLLSVSFMAPIFMFFLYFIFKLVQSKIFDGMIDKKNTDFIGTILLIVIPALVILILLLKATDFAKKGSGKLGEMMVNGAKMVGGLALGAAGGAALGGAAMLGRAGIGRAGAAMANSEWAKKREAQGKFGSGVFRDVTSKIGSGSFDVRGVKIGGKTLASATGMNLGEAQKGGFTERKKEQVEKRQKRAKDLEVGENEGLKQNLNKTEADLQGLLDANSKELADLDKLIGVRRQALSDANAQFGAGSTEATKAGLDLNNYKNRKTALKNGKNYTGDIDINTGSSTTANAKNYTAVNAGTYVDAAGVTQVRTINHMEDIELRDRKQDVVDENRKRKRSYADSQQTGWSRTKGYVLSGGAYTKAASQEAAHRIRMDAKVEEKK